MADELNIGLNPADVLQAAGSQLVTGRDLGEAVRALAESDSDLASPELLYGRDAWAGMLAEDPEGIVARSRFDFDWNFGSTPRSRAEAAWFNGFRDNGFDLLRSMDETTYEATKSIDAARLDTVRRRRAGRGGV